MARLAIATALLTATTVLASAQGPSYESRGYGGPLYVGPNFQAGGQHSAPIYGPKSTSKKRSNKKSTYRAAKERKESPAKATEAAKTPATGAIETENSSLSAASTVSGESGGERDVATKGIETENSTISGEAIETGATSTTTSGKMDQPQATQNVGCKKYFPSAGMTLTVPCE